MKGVIVFVRNPELGKVKTRLAASVGDKKALDIYVQLLEHTRLILEESGYDQYVFYTPYVDHNDSWQGLSTHKFLQNSGNLGERITNALLKVFQSCDEVLIIGSDCAQLKPAHIHKAFDSLLTNDCVIGPTLDGGYYLLGMKTFHPILFENIAWSTESVFRSTIEIMETNDLSYALLETLSDIDYIEDWEKYGLNSHN